MRNTIKFSIFFDSLKNIPFPALSFLGVVSAVLFNMGYFAAVGINYMSLFPLQESIVFSITGSVASASVIAAMQGVANLLDVIPSRNEQRSIFVIKSVASALIAALVIYSAIHQAFKYHEDGGYPVSIPFSVFITIGVIMALLILLRKAQCNINFYILILMLLSISFVMCGVLYGNSAIYGQEIKGKSFGIMPDGREATVVRLGSEYSLVAFGDHSVHAVRTDGFKDIYTKPSF